MPSPATWTLLHIRSPYNTVAGSTGQFGELTHATSRKLTFSTAEADTLSFDMPGNHPQTAKITPLVDDVLAFRDDRAVQRFRVVSRSLSKESGVLKASFSAVAYRALLDAWVFHDGDQRSWATATDQADIAWTIVNQGQSKPSGNLGITRGVVPSRPVTRILTGSVTEGGDRPEYFLAGMKRSEALDQLAGLSDGFEWVIEPDTADPYRGLSLNVWNVGARNQHPVRSPLVLDDGGSMMSWSHTVTPTDFGNVVRFTGAETTDENGSAAATPILPVWRPASRNPADPASEGRWERDINNGDLTTQRAVNAAAPRAFDDANLYVPEITATLRRGRWRGPDQLWVGDYARLIITEPVVGDPASYVLYVDEDARIVELDIDVDEQGAEDVAVSLNRRKFSTRTNTRAVNDRLVRLERR